MNLEADNWSVVVAGFWNPAILTPAGIATRLFQLPEGTPVVIEAPIDGLAPTRVRYNKLTVTAEVGRLLVAADEPVYGILDRARQVAIRAIQGLPETPYAAAGYNIRIKFQEPTETFSENAKCSIDDVLSDAGYKIIQRELGRSLEMPPGVLNISLHQAEETALLFNFHRQSSKKEELIEWLGKPIADIEKVVSGLLNSLSGIQFEGLGK